MNGIGLPTLSSSRIAANRSLSRTQVERGIPANCADCRNACFSSGSSRMRMFSDFAIVFAPCPDKAEYQSRALRNLTCKRIQCDEIWSFCYAKAKNVPEDKKGQFGYGDVWTWVAICADSKLVPAWLVGNRDAETASIFMEDLASRFVHKVQLTTDGLKIYLDAVEGAFGADIDYAMLVKMYGESAEAKMQKRYSPAKFTGSKKEVIAGNPERKHISTSYAERQNLTMRMSMRRFTRLTNGFSKKVENHADQIALHYMHYNFCRLHKTLRVTPAMAAEVTDRLWEIEDIVALLDSK